MIVPLEKPGTPQELVEHSGVKGMKWGVRNEDQTSGRQSTSNETSGLSDRQKKILIGAGVAAAILGTYGAYKLVDSGQFSALKNKDVSFRKNDLLLRKMSSKQIMKEVVPNINPEFGTIGTKNNCRRCTFAYEMRRRGFDVLATKTFSGSGQNAAGLTNAITPGSKVKSGVGMIMTMAKDKTESGPLWKIANSGGLGLHSIGDSKTFSSLTPQAKSTTIFNSLRKMPEGSRGELTIGYKVGGLHSMAWEVINKRPHIFDTQEAKLYNESTFKKVTELVDSANFTRLDNISLNNQFLKRWVSNVNG